MSLIFFLFWRKYDILIPSKIFSRFYIPYAPRMNLSEKKHHTPPHSNTPSIVVNHVLQSVFDLLNQPDLQEYSHNRAQKLLDRIHEIWILLMQQSHATFESIWAFEQRLLQDDELLYQDFLLTLGKQPEWKALLDELKSFFQKPDLLKHYIWKFFDSIIVQLYSGKETKFSWEAWAYHPHEKLPIHPSHYPYISTLDDVSSEELDTTLQLFSPIKHMEIRSLWLLWGNDNTIHTLLWHMKHLRILDLEVIAPQKLHDCQLEAFFQVATHLKLFKLNCMDALMIQAPAVRRMIPYFQLLWGVALDYLDLNDMDGEDASELFYSLSHVHILSLKDLKIARCDPETIEKLFWMLHSLRTLNLSSVTLSLWSSEMRKALFKNLQHIKHIDLSENDLGKMTNEHIWEVFGNLPSLTSINLTGTHLSPAQAALILTYSPKIETSLWEDLKALVASLPPVKHQKKMSKHALFSSFFQKKR